MDNIRVYEVGGAVRDEIMGLPNKDIDYAVEAPSFDAMRAYILSVGGTIFLETPDYFTIRARVGKTAADYVLCRKDGAYSDGRRPDSVEAGTIYDDLARRDFTMNAIAKAANGNFIDPFNGRADIAGRIVRCVGSTEDRMREDYLRLVRAARFSITKEMSIDVEICRLFFDVNVLDSLRKSVSMERIRAELQRMFEYNTLRSIFFFGQYPLFAQACFGSDIWLKATNEAR